MQLAWPEEFRIFNVLLGDKWAPNGVMTNDIYLSLVTIHGTIMVFFCTAALSGTFSNLLIPLQIGARYGFRFYEYASYWLFFLSSLIMISSLFAESGPRIQVDDLPSFKCLPQAIGGSGLYDIMVGVNGYFHCIVLNGIVELYSYRNQFEDRGNVH
jgi:cytochrome c oxidase subunit 1